MRTISVAFGIGVLALAGCGGSTPAPAASTSSAPPSSQSQLQQSLLSYAECMRSHGVPNFPDPGPDGGFQLPAGSGASPAFTAAQAKCRKLMPGGSLGPSGPTHPTSQWLAHMVKVAQCMRRHGISGFPDPRTSVPSPLPLDGLISDIDGAVFVFPASIDTQSPQFTRAATACGFPQHNH